VIDAVADQPTLLLERADPAPVFVPRPASRPPPELRSELTCHWTDSLLAQGEPLMSDLTLNAEKRTQFGKGAARKIRRDHKIPAVMYGHGADPIHITLPGHDTMMALKNPNALLTIVIDGGDEQLALAKDVQRDPIKPIIEHVDLVVVRKGEKVTVDIPVHVEGEAGPETVVQVDHTTISVEAEATHIPENVTVSIEGLPAGTQIHASDLRMPQGATLVTDGEALVINITQMVSEAALEAELSEAEAGIEQESAGEAAEAPAEAAAEAPAEGEQAE
jgi:large subunit ribosomal protein L25